MRVRLLQKAEPRTPASKAAREHQIEWVPPRTLRGAPHNTRAHSKSQIELIARSIDRRGFISPLGVKDNIVYIGNGRFKAALMRGISRVPIIRLDHMSDTEIRAYAIDDNKLSDLSTFDRPLLASAIDDLLQTDGGIDLLVGFSPPEIDRLLSDHIDSESEPSDHIPQPPNRAIARLGDLWVFGKSHRLYCGDALASQSWKTLFGHERATAVVSDLPFNLTIKSIVGRGSIKHDEFLQASGEMSEEEFQAFLLTALRLAVRYSIDGSLHYLFMDWRHALDLMTVGKEVYTSLKNLIVWVKTNGGQGSFYRSQHELILMFKNGDSPHLNGVELGKHGRNRTNVWTYAGVNTFRSGRLDDLASHPTVKPVALIADAIRDCSRRGDVIADPFLGSGTLILAAEKTGRRGFGMELDPRYVDVAIRRWQAFTGRVAASR